MQFFKISNTISIIFICIQNLIIKIKMYMKKKLQGLKLEKGHLFNN